MATASLFVDLADLRHKWGWFVVLGITQIIFGLIALSIIPVATIATVMILGWLMVFGGVIETIHGFQVHRWGGMFLHLIAGIAGVLIGLLVVTHPLAGALVWTLLFASFFTVIGLFRLMAALRLRFPKWGWAAFDGGITFLLGIGLWMAWPSSGLWFLGFTVGISLILRGWSHVMLALAVRSLVAAPRELRRVA